MGPHPLPLRMKSCLYAPSGFTDTKDLLLTHWCEFCCSKSHAFSKKGVLVLKSFQPCIP